MFNPPVGVAADQLPFLSSEVGPQTLTCLGQQDDRSTTCPRLGLLDLQVSGILFQTLGNRHHPLVQFGPPCRTDTEHVLYEETGPAHRRGLTSSAPARYDKPRYAPRTLGTKPGSDRRRARRTAAG